MKPGTKVTISTPTVVTPDYFGEVIRETLKQVIVKVTGVNPATKHSPTFTTVFNEEKVNHFSQNIGKTYRFWKITGRQVSGEQYINKL